MKYIYDKNKLPTEPHFAVLEFCSIYVPGDQRSVEAPGHGYPAHDEPTIRYIVFTDEAELNRWVQKKHENQFNRLDNWAIIHAIPKMIEVKATIK